MATITDSINQLSSGKISAVELVEKIIELVNARNNYLPEGTKLEVVNDMSKPVDDILMILESNALMGLLMVLIVLWFFLGIRNATFAALGIPVSFMATFIFLKVSGLEREKCARENTNQMRVF